MLSAVLGWNYLVTHPEVVVAALGSLGAVGTAYFKPRSPEEYAAMSPRKAAFMKLMSAAFPDILKGLSALEQIKSGKSDVEMRLPVEKK